MQRILNLLSGLALWSSPIEEYVEPRPDDIAVGISLGRSFSRIAWYNTTWEKIEVFEDEWGSPKIPNYVTFTGSEVLIGRAAKEQWVNATNTIFDFPALLGKTFSQVEDEVQHLPYTVVARDGRPMIQVEQEHQVQEYSPEAITAHMLAYLKRIAEERIGKPVKFAMINRPSFLDNAGLARSEGPDYSEAFKKALEEASALAGLQPFYIGVFGSTISPPSSIFPRDSSSTMGSYLGFDGETMDSYSYLTYTYDHRGYTAAISEGESGVFESLSQVSYSYPLAMNGTAGELEHPMPLTSEAWLKANDVENSYPDVLPDRASDIIDQAMELARDRDPLRRVRRRKLDIGQVFIAGDMAGYPAIRSMLNQRFNESCFTRVDEGLKSGFELGSSPAMGAALHASRLLDQPGGCALSTQLVEPIANPLGIEIHDGIYEYLMRDGTILPEFKRNRFRVPPGQSMITLNFYEGFAALAKEATPLGSLDFPLFNGMNACSMLEIRADVVDLDYYPEHTTEFFVRDVESGYNVTLKTPILPRKEKQLKPIRSRETGSTTPAEDRARNWLNKIALRKKGVNARIELVEKLQLHGPVGGNRLTPLEGNEYYSLPDTLCEGQIDGPDAAWIDNVLRRASITLDSLNWEQGSAERALAKATRRREEEAAAAAARNSTS